MLSNYRNGHTFGSALISRRLQREEECLHRPETLAQLKHFYLKGFISGHRLKDKLCQSATAGGLLQCQAHLIV